MGGHDVLVFSVWAEDTGHGTVYALGRWSAGRFEIERWGALTFGASPYAPTVYRDAQGLPCITFWLRDVVDPDGTWAGAHSLPWRLSVAEGALHLSPDEDALRHLLPVGLGADVHGASIVRWDPGADGDLVGVTATGASWSIRATPHELVVEVGDRRSAMPRAHGAALLVVHGPIVEMAHGGAVLAAVVPVSTAIIRTGVRSGRRAT